MLNQPAPPNHVITAHFVLQAAADKRPTATPDPFDPNILDVWATTLYRWHNFSEQELVAAAKEWATSHFTGWHITPRDVLELAKEAYHA
ncbi:hypothetical protein [Corynebacterium striatum]|uniref:hypothetical protein n=1 Tax=Corynebacterium striatum TaxID=43770 RepID=UPI000D76C52A|nr:hypothetical protein [Corynebacterium striatum]PXY04634.1 hypothetical protein CKF53_09400 [Corynebacterium striatum]